MKNELKGQNKDKPEFDYEKWAKYKVKEYKEGEKPVKDCKCNRCGSLFIPLVIKEGEVNEQVRQIVKCPVCQSMLCLRI